MPARALSAGWAHQGRGHGARLLQTDDAKQLIRPGLGEKPDWDSRCMQMTAAVNEEEIE